MTREVVKRNGKRYALIDPLELRQLEKLAASAQENGIPAWPPADSKGSRPAVAFARVSIARKIIEQRRALGISQQELARLSGLRQETISRLESGKHSPTIRTVDKIDLALRQAARPKRRGRDNANTTARKRKATR